MADDPIKNTPVTGQTPTEPAVIADEAKKQEPAIKESHEEKLRRAKIAMEGLDRTIRREATEKEEEASEEKQQLNKLLLSLDHEKELMELTWVNLDDKRASLKKVLEPILEQEDKLEAEETSLESQEEVTMEPKARRELEQKRWQVQESRKKTEEEKWLVEEKVQKIDDQVEETKQKYQKLLAQEEELRQKIQAIDEQMLLQQEVLRQQHELEEQKRRQETLKQVEEQKRAAEAEKARLEEIKKAEEERKLAEEERQKAESTKQTDEQARVVEKERLEKLRLAEEERQTQETARRLQAQQEREVELKKKIADAIDKNNGITPVPQTPVAKEEEPKEAELQRALELERIKRENEEAEAERRKQLVEKNRSVINEIKESDSELAPLRTLKGDLETALRDNQISNDDLARVNKKVFPWANK
ncbi:MAG: hypothetical protein WC385_00775 [Candidatus Paceibacterota bacterium]|jgi:hypothetical protein